MPFDTPVRRNLFWLIFYNYLFRFLVIIIM
jgi:hypothetical protein